MKSTKGVPRPRASQPTPTIASRRLGAQLKRLRDDAGLTCDQVARKLSCSPSRISRIESGEIRVRPGDVYELVEVYGVAGDTRQRLAETARELKRDADGWWQPFADVFPKRSLRYLALESAATTIKAYELSTVHGLLQTEAYARAAIRAGRVIPVGSAAGCVSGAEVTGSEYPDAEEIDRLVAARLARQANTTPRKLHVLHDEAALRRPVGGPELLARQLRHLVELAEREHITLQVVPLTVGAHPSLAGSVTLLDFVDDGDSAAAYTRTVNGDLVVEAAPDVRRLTTVLDRLSALALTPEDSKEFTHRLAATL